MALTRRQQFVSTLFLLMALISFAILIYRAFTADFTVRQREYQRRAEAARPPSKSMVGIDRVIIMRGEAVTVNRTRLVYRGRSDGGTRSVLTNNTRARAAKPCQWPVALR